MKTDKYLARFVVMTQNARRWINVAFTSDDEGEAKHEVKAIQNDPGKGRERIVDVHLYERKPMGD
jgi:hypothetical protein